jgi:hypothetical protein
LVASAPFAKEAPALRDQNKDTDELTPACKRPMPTAEDICRCLVAGDVKQGFHATRCKPIGPEEVRGARLLRYDGGTRDYEVYLAVQTAAGWQAIHHVEHEFERAHGESAMHPSSQRELVVDGHRLYRLDYRVSSDSDSLPEPGTAADAKGELVDNGDDKDDRVLLCVLDGASTPRCTVDVSLSCGKGHAKLEVTPAGMTHVTTEGAQHCPTIRPRAVW